MNPSDQEIEEALRMSDAHGREWVKTLATAYRNACDKIDSLETRLGLAEGKTSFCPNCETLAKKLARAIDDFRWVKQTVHQAHHDEETIENCRKNTCVAINHTVAAIGEKP